MVIHIVGNKLDLSHDRAVEEEVSGTEIGLKPQTVPNHITIFSNQQEATSYAREQKLAYFETSAKDGTNIDELFINLGE